MAISGHELIEQLVSVGGELRIVNPSTPDRHTYRSAIHAAINDGLLPAGKCLRHTRRDRGDLVIRLVTEEERRGADPPAPIRVPETLRQLHPILAATREHAKSAGRSVWLDTQRTPGVMHMKITKKQLPRALRIAQGVVEEAERRGYGVKAASGFDCDRGLGIAIGRHMVELCFREPTTRQIHVVTPAEARAKERGPYTYIGPYDYLPTGRLELRQGHGYHDAPLASDRVRFQLEDRLPRVFTRLESIAAEAEQRQLERERTERERQLAWIAAMERAREQYVEKFKERFLLDQITQIQRATTMREYVEAVRSHCESVEDKTWLEWVSDYADQIDPLRAPIAAPQPPEPKAEDLKEFLGSWSPYGPDRVSLW